MRPKNIADDFTGTNAVIKQVIEQFESENIQIDYGMECFMEIFLNIWDMNM